MKVSAASVSELKQRVKDERSNGLRHVDAADCVVWRCKPKLSTKATADYIKNLTFNDDAMGTELAGDDEIRELGLADKKGP
jgi:hypothetical protein